MRLWLTGRLGWVVVVVAGFLVLGAVGWVEPSGCGVRAGRAVCESSFLGFLGQGVDLGQRDLVEFVGSLVGWMAESGLRHRF